ncbi:MAG: outer membrane protein transport protein [Gammaproteobacteria bacterium]|nr:outer membrane protein transport protein [Gammaproteobacteria bacterium]
MRMALLSAMTVPTTAFATNGYQLIGVGSYQKGLAGAVTANPGSAMTAVTNPAGAARIGSRADFSMEAFMPDRSVDFTAVGGGKEESAVDMYGIPAIGWTAPTSDGSDVYFGGGMYGTSGMGVDYGVTAGPVFPGPTNTLFDGYSNISFWQMAPVLAWNVDEKLSLGASLNIDYQSVALKQRFTDTTTPLPNTLQQVDLSRSASSFGLGLGLGILYDPIPAVTLGFSYKSKQNFSDLEYQLATGDITLMGTALPAGTYSLDLDYPQQAAVGIAYRAGNKLTFSGDIKWINWSDTMKQLIINGPAGPIPYNSGWDDQTVFAIGINYDINDKFTIRGGYNYAESPIGPEDVANNLILPAVVETHYTIGGDYRINNHWDLAFHYMYVPENTVTSTDPQMPGAKISLSETSFGLNIGYRF